MLINNFFNGTVKSDNTGAQDLIQWTQEKYTHKYGPGLCCLAVSLSLLSQHAQSPTEKEQRKQI